VFLECSPVVLAVPVKACSMCGEVKPATREYFRTRGNKLRAYCSECDRVKCREYHKNHREIQLEKQKEWYRNNAEYRANYYSANRERRAKNYKAYREANRDRLVENCRKWRLSNPNRAAEYRKENADYAREKKREYLRTDRGRAVISVLGHRRRALKRSLPNTFTAADWQFALDYFGGVCAVCGRPRGLWHTLAIDHWIPVNKGGPTTPDNIVPLCHGVGGCNNFKSDRSPSEWLIERFGPRKGRAIQRRIEAYLNSRKPREEDAS
jgi:hypothetical protein